jgi:thermitase
MRPGRLSVVVACLLGCGLAACGSGPGTRLAPPLPAAETSAPAAARRAAWERLAHSPGCPGVDYDPQRITVTYLPGAVLPPGWSAVPPQPAHSAAAQPNPSLRQLRQYEPLTDALAARYGLGIGQQVYLPGISFASFRLPAGTDGAALLQTLRSEGAGLLEAAVFTPLQHAAYEPDDPDFALGADGPQWDEWLVNCPQAWERSRGDPGVVIGLVDSGVRLTHEELGQVIDPGTAFPAATCDLANNDKDIEDATGHGTFIAGLLCAAAGNGRSIAGVAPLCRVLPVKISNGTTAGTDVLTAGALLAGQLGARIVNFSWGGYSDDPNEQAAVDQLTADGVLFVCAAGNDGLYESNYPTAYANALSVGATDRNDICCPFSNWGPGVDLTAPGLDLKSCGAASDTDYVLGGAGTSFAAPLVAATAGLLWSFKPGLTIAELRTALEETGAETAAFALPIRRLDAGAALDSVITPVVPSVGGLLPAAGAVFGSVPGTPLLAAHLVGAVNVVRVSYTLDLLPLGVAGPEDLQLESTRGADFPAQFELAGLHNQPAVLTARCYSPTGQHATLSAQPLWVFNRRGDLDGNGTVDAADLDALRPLLGRQAGDAGYSAFADSDQDGRLTEADAAAVGYFFGQ